MKYIYADWQVSEQHPSRYEKNYDHEDMVLGMKLTSSEYQEILEMKFNYSDLQASDYIQVDMRLLMLKFFFYHLQQLLLVILFIFPGIEPNSLLSKFSETFLLLKCWV